MFLGKNPIQGGSVVVRVSFRDESGQEYVPVDGSGFYALLAQNNDKETWSVVRPWGPVRAASVVDIVIQGQDLELLSGCTLKRRIVLEWRYLRGGEEILGKESLDFEVSPLPVTDPALGPPPPIPFPEPVPVEDIVDGFEGYDSGLNLSVRAAGGFIEMSRGTVLAEDVVSGLWAFVYSFSAPGEIQLVGVHGDTHEVSSPLFRATVKVVGNRWTLIRVDENGLGLESGTVFNFQPVS
jgi:hypothetical protein